MKEYPIIDIESPAPGSTGCLPFTAKVAGRYMEVGEVDDVPIIHESEWVEFDDSDQVADYTYDQGQLPTCCSNASCGALRAEDRKTGIESPPIYSAEAIHVLAGASPNDGLEIGAALEVLMADGVPTTDTVPLHEAAFTPGNWKSAWKEEAAGNRVLEAFFAQNFEAAMSMAQKGLAVVIGVFWEGGGGHAIYVVGAAKQNGQWGFLIKNSWGKDWEANGVAWISRKACSGISSFGAYGVRSRRRIGTPVPQPEVA